MTSDSQFHSRTILVNSIIAVVGDPKPTAKFINTIIADWCEHVEDAGIVFIRNPDDCEGWFSFIKVPKSVGVVVIPSLTNDGRIFSASTLFVQLDDKQPCVDKRLIYTKDCNSAWAPRGTYAAVHRTSQRPTGVCVHQYG